MTDKDKLEKAVKLADAMYHAAQYLTTDASRLRKAMDEYHQFIITEYNRQEPALNRADIINSGQYKVARASVDWYQAHQDADCLDGFEAGAQWQKESIIKMLDAEKENTGIGLCEYDAGHENGRMEVIDTLKNKLIEK